MKWKIEIKKEKIIFTQHQGGKTYFANDILHF
jgi:hypothetical protein